jgi:hypothetical protein
MKFLKFTWSKLIIFILLIVLTVYSSASFAQIFCSRELGGGTCPQPGFPAGNSFFKGVFYVLALPFAVTNALNLSNVIGIGLNLIYLYLISCLIVKIYKKVRG